MKCDECARLLAIFRDAVDQYSIQIKQLSAALESAQFHRQSVEVKKCRKLAEAASSALENHKREEHAA